MGLGSRNETQNNRNGINENIIKQHLYEYGGAVFAEIKYYIYRTNTKFKINNKKTAILPNIMLKQVNVGLIVAMKEEAEILASALKLTQKPNSSGTFIQFTNRDETIILLTPGVDPEFTAFGQPVCRVGKASAAVITTLLVQQFHPKLIINCGTCGGIATTGIQIGDIVIADSITNHDIRIPIPGYAEYGVRKLVINGLDSLNFLKSPYKIGTISSGESFTTTQEEWRLIKKSGAIVKEMEAAGVMQALQILDYKKPFYVIKAVTDMVKETTSGQNSSEQFVINFKLSMEKLSTVVKEIVTHKDLIIRVNN